MCRDPPPHPDGCVWQWEKLPPLVAMLREMVAIINVLYYSRSPTNKDVAGQLLRQLIYEWDFGGFVCRSSCCLLGI